MARNHFYSSESRCCCLSPWKDKVLTHSVIAKGSLPYFFDMPLKRIISIREKSMHVKHPGSEVRRTDVTSLALEPFLQQDPLSSIQCFLAFKPSNVPPSWMHILLPLPIFFSQLCFEMLSFHHEVWSKVCIILFNVTWGIRSNAPTKNTMKDCLIWGLGQSVFL